MKVTQSHITTQIDENGEIKNRIEDKIINYGSEPNYVKLYTKDILYHQDIPKGFNSILMSFLSRMSYASDEQVIFINSAMKRLMSKELKISMDRINHAITNFVKGKILIRKDVGMYQFNPYLFGKGDWADIARIRLSVEFEYKDGSTFSSVVKEYDDKTKKQKEQEKQNEKKEQVILESQSQSQSQMIAV